jgi:dipeptide/tripeptide permease
LSVDDRSLSSRADVDLFSRVKTCQRFQHAFSQWRTLRKVDKRPSMVDYARERFGDEFVEEVKALFDIIYIFMPLIVFWSLFDQQVTQ